MLPANLASKHLGVPRAWPFETTWATHRRGHVAASTRFRWREAQTVYPRSLDVETGRAQSFRSSWKISSATAMEHASSADRVGRSRHQRKLKRYGDQGSIWHWMSDARACRNSDCADLRSEGLAVGAASSGGRNCSSVLTSISPQKAASFSGAGHFSM